ncbi:unnamed protein product [Rotaria sp. Silwood2]|nr:unnamed protein product [Rotaria sp. Silwood2]
MTTPGLWTTATTGSSSTTAFWNATTTGFEGTAPYGNTTGFSENSTYSYYSNTLTFNSTRYPNVSKYYQAIQVIVYTSGTYSLASSSSMDTYGYLYGGTFDPFNTNYNLLAQNDDQGGNNQFQMIVDLQAGVPYTLVFTTYQENVIGPFSVIAAGPGYVQMVSSNTFEQGSTMSTTTIGLPSTIGFLTTTTTRSPSTTAFWNATTTGFEGTAPYGNTTGFPENSTYSYYSNTLTFNSTRYPNVSKYYQAIQVIVYTSGTYSLASSSSMDTYGYLYGGTFDPFNTNYNLLAQNDDQGGNNQFQMIVDLQAGVPYTLVFTTYQENVIGPFSIIAAGPDYVQMVSNNAFGQETTSN